jgi:hypothetical protein
MNKYSLFYKCDDNYLDIKYIKRLIPYLNDLNENEFDIKSFSFINSQKHKQFFCYFKKNNTYSNIY